MKRDEFEQCALSALDGLYAYARRLTQNHEDAADLVQEAYVRALARPEGFKEAAAVRPMLFRIMYHCFVDEWRRKKRRPHLVPLRSPGEGDVPDGDPAPNFFVKEALSEDVEQAVNELDDVLRETLWLREIEDFTYSEIANITGVPIGTVRSRLHRARGQLAAALKEYGIRRGYEAVQKKGGQRGG